MSETISPVSKSKKEKPITDQIIIARLVAMKACEEAECEHLAKFSKSPELKKEKSSIKNGLQKKNGNDVMSSSGLLPEEEVEYLERLNKQDKQVEPKKTGVEQDSGLLPEEEAGYAARLKIRKRKEKRLARAAERAKKIMAKKQLAESAVSSEPLEVSPVAEQKVETPVAELEPKAEISGQVEARQEAEQLNLKLETLPVEKWGVSGEEAKREPNGEKLFDKIHRLNEEVAEARAKYVQEDYENTKLWKKLASLFYIKGDQKKGEWRELYEAKTLELQKAELEMVEAGEKNKQRDTRKEMSGLLRYYKLNEQVNLINERTQYRAKNLTFGERIGDTFGVLGRVYNRIPTKYKLALSGALIGASVATGGVLGATVYATVAARRLAAGAGLAVGAEAGLEKFGERRRARKTGEEIEQQMFGLEGTTNEAFSGLEEILKQDILSLDNKLQHEKRAKTYRKLAATTLGVAVGSGWLSQIIMDKFGGKEAVEWVKESLGFGEAVSEDLSFPNPPVTTEMAADMTVKAASEARDNFINQFVNQDIVVEKGDSVWKISERLADNLGLDGAEKTHFIDAIKDKFGDVQLKAGEHINFSGAGINEDFVKHALEDSNAISPEQSAQILENNTRLAAFAEANPNVRLTDEVTKNILEGKPSVSGVTPADTFHNEAISGGDGAMSELDQHIKQHEALMNSSDPESVRTIEQLKELREHWANTQRFVDYMNAHPEIDREHITFGELNSIMVKNNLNPDWFSQLNEQEQTTFLSHTGFKDIAENMFNHEVAISRADGWYNQIFKVENVQFEDRVLGRDAIESLKIRDVLHDANLFRQGAETGYTTGLSRQEIANFAKFDINASNSKSILFDRAGFFRNNPNATVLDYLKKIASLTKRGQHIGPYISL